MASSLLRLDLTTWLFLSRTHPSSTLAEAVAGLILKGTFLTIFFQIRMENSGSVMGILTLEFYKFYTESLLSGGGISRLYQNIGFLHYFHWLLINLEVFYNRLLDMMLYHTIPFDNMMIGCYNSSA